MSKRLMVLGPLVVIVPCPRCDAEREHSRRYDPTWGEVMRTCRACGLESVDQPIR